MSSYTLNPVDGDQVFQSNQKGELYHDVAFRANGSSPTGTIVLSARKPGSKVFEAIPDGTFDLNSLASVQFTGAVKEYKATISGISGVNTIHMTDTAQRA